MGAAYAWGIGLGASVIPHNIRMGIFYYQEQYGKPMPNRHR